MPMTIRSAGVEDTDQIVEFNCRLAEETEGKTLNTEVVNAGVMAALTDPQKGPYFLAVEGDHILGQLQITFEWSDWRNGWFWWIQGVYVRSEARRQGVFRALFKHVERIAHESGNVVGIRLYVEKENRRAQKTYEELGMNPSDYLLYDHFYF